MAAGTAAPRRALGHLFLIGALLCLAAPLVAGAPWRTLREGLSMGEFRPPGHGAGLPITILRIDGGRYALRLLSASENGGTRLTAREWARRHHLLAAVNAGMYQADGTTSVGLMKNDKHYNNPRLNRYRAVLAFDPVDGTVPPIQIIDRECQDFEALKGKYRTLIQNIRMIDCHGRNVWQKQDKAWNMVILGVDADGNVLLILSGAPYQPREFIDTLLALPLSLRAAVYLEGGPVASFYLSAGGVEIERTGAGGDPGSDSPAGSTSLALPFPNVIGIVEK